MCINRDKIKSLRIEKGWKRNELAVKMETSESVIWSIEQDKKYDPRINTIKKLSKIFDVEIKDILL